MRTLVISDSNNAPILFVIASHDGKDSENEVSKDNESEELSETDEDTSNNKQNNNFEDEVCMDTDK